MAGGRPLWVLMEVHTPFAADVEREAQRLLGRRREWSERGTEWFRLRSPRSAENAVLKAARTVRRVAKLRRRWSREADGDTWITDRDGRRKQLW